MLLNEYLNLLKESINDLNEESKSEWLWFETDSHTDEEHVQNFITSLQKTRAHFKFEEKTKLQFIGDENACIMAQIGNTESAKARAKYFTMVQPMIMLDIINILLEGGNGKIMVHNNQGDVNGN